MTIDELKTIIRNIETAQGAKPAYVTIPRDDWLRIRDELEDAVRNLAAHERPGNDIGLYEFTVDGVPVIAE